MLTNREKFALRIIKLAEKKIGLIKKYNSHFDRWKNLEDNINLVFHEFVSRLVV